VGVRFERVDSNSGQQCGMCAWATARRGSVAADESLGMAVMVDLSGARRANQDGCGSG